MRATEPARRARERHGRRDPQAGFSLLELVVVVCLIAILFVIALDRIWSLRAEAERVAVAQTVGALRSALGLEVARIAVEEGPRALGQLDRANPMDLMMQPPTEYLGELRAPDPALISPGSWHFDAESRELVYRIRFPEAVQSAEPPPLLVRYAIAVVFRDRNGNGIFDRGVDEVEGVDLRPVKSYRWVRRPPGLFSSWFGGGAG